jgi:predicted small secreted protein
MKHISLVLVSVVLLAACSERNQALGEGRDHGDAVPWDGSKHGYMASGWTPGDQASWQKQIKARNQAQNEYNRTN